jgi:pilus assembly protein CpaF
VLGSLTPSAADFLRAAARARASILVSGGTAAGKTTLLNALGAAIAADSERVVVCEDTPELQLPFLLSDCVALQVREDNVEGEGRITLRDLVRAALRMRPDRIILGESRGAEAYDVLQALNTGHEGGMTSVHANTAREALTRLVTMAAQAPERLGIPVLSRMVAQSVDLVCHVARDPLTGRRRVVQVAEVAGQEGDELLTNDLWALDPAPAEGLSGAPLRWTGIPPRCAAKMALWGVPYRLPPSPGWAE